MDDIYTAAEAGADELIVDLNLQDWFTPALGRCL
jgi:hypothetical protein